MNKIRANTLNRQEFREYCEMLDLEYDNLVLHSEVCWLCGGHVMKRFLKLKNTVHDFLEE